MTPPWFMCGIYSHHTQSDTRRASWPCEFCGFFETHICVATSERPTFTVGVASFGGSLPLETRQYQTRPATPTATTSTPPTESTMAIRWTVFCSSKGREGGGSGGEVGGCKMRGGGGFGANGGGFDGAGVDGGGEGSGEMGEPEGGGGEGRVSEGGGASGGEEGGGSEVAIEGSGSEGGSGGGGKKRRTPQSAQSVPCRHSENS